MKVFSIISLLSSFFFIASASAQSSTSTAASSASTGLRGGRRDGIITGDLQIVPFDNATTDWSKVRNITVTVQVGENFGDISWKLIDASTGQVRMQDNFRNSNYPGYVRAIFGPTPVGVYRLVVTSAYGKGMVGDKGFVKVLDSTGYDPTGLTGKLLYSYDASKDANFGGMLQELIQVKA